MNRPLPRLYPDMSVAYGANRSQRIADARAALYRPAAPARKIDLPPLPKPPPPKLPLLPFDAADAWRPRDCTSVLAPQDTPLNVSRRLRAIHSCDCGGRVAGAGQPAAPFCTHCQRVASSLYGCAAGGCTCLHTTYVDAELRISQNCANCAKAGDCEPLPAPPRKFAGYRSCCRHPDLCAECSQTCAAPGCSRVRAWTALRGPRSAYCMHCVRALRVASATAALLGAGARSVARWRGPPQSSSLAGLVLHSQRYCTTVSALLAGAPAGVHHWLAMLSELTHATAAGLAYLATLRGGSDEAEALSDMLRRLNVQHAALRPS